jgi:DNA-binding NarL/FixJ family response regulator
MKNERKDQRNRRIASLHKRGWTNGQIAKQESISPTRVRIILMEERTRGSL